MLKSNFIGLAAICVIAAGCAPQNLYVSHDVVVGVNAQLSADRQQGRLLVGYDRDFITIIPKSVEVPGEEGREVMSLLGCTELTVDGIFISSFADTLASGEVAKKFAASLAEDTRFFDCHDRAEGADE